MAWLVKVIEIRKPSLVDLSVGCDLFKDGELVARCESPLEKEAILAATDAQRLALVRSAVRSKVAEYIRADKAANALSRAVGVEFDPED